MTNILNVKSGIICHAVNCRGRMDAGIAKELREKYPKIYQDYIYFLKTENDLPSDALGKISITTIDTNLVVASLFTQLGVSKVGRSTDYEALAKSLEVLNQYSVGMNKKIYVPEKMSCVNGGADWRIVKAMLDTYLVTGYTICKKKDIEPKE